MKDMIGIELEVGQDVFYFRAGCGGVVHEEAKVIKISQVHTHIRVHIRVEFSGNGNWNNGKRKEKGQRSNIYNTKRRILIINDDLTVRRLVQVIADLQKENKELRVEVNKIHNRFELLDL